MTAPLRRPGGRSTRVRAAVLDAAEQLIQDGVWPLSVAAVAAASGVSDVTIYRRWGSIEALVVEAATLDVQNRLPLERTGDPRKDVLGWAERAYESISSGRGLRLLRSVIELKIQRGTAADVGLGDFVRLRMEGIAALGGPLGPSLDPVLFFDAVLAPMYLRLLFGYAEVNVQELVAQAFERSEQNSRPMS